MYSTKIVVCQTELSPSKCNFNSIINCYVYSPTLDIYYLPNQCRGLYKSFYSSGGAFSINYRCTDIIINHSHNHKVACTYALFGNTVTVILADKKSIKDCNCCH